MGEYVRGGERGGRAQLLSEYEEGSEYVVDGYEVVLRGEFDLFSFVNTPTSYLRSYLAGGKLFFARPGYSSLSVVFYAQNKTVTWLGYRKIR